MMGDAGGTKASSQSEPVMKGWLFKWTNYLKGYQRRWFVLQDGQLSYYRVENHGGVSTLSLRRRRRFRNTDGNQAEISHMCRGNISLQGALIHTVDACTFMISNGGTQTFHIRAASEVERQSWVTALELAKAKTIRNIESEEEEEEAEEGSGSPEDWSGAMRELKNSLENVNTCLTLITKHGAALHRELGDLENIVDSEAAQGKSKSLGERATLFRVASNAMMNACTQYLQTAKTHYQKYFKLLQHEKEQRQQLQEMVETLAQQHSRLEKAATAHTHRTNGPVNASEGEEDENEFFHDALGDGGSLGGSSDRFTLNIPTAKTNQRRNSSDSNSESDDNPHDVKKVVVVTNTARVDNPDGDSVGYSDDADATGNALKKVGLNSEALAEKKGASPRCRRTHVPDKPNYPLNLWSIMKNCIGKDLSKIPMPVNFSEPLSMLQRLAEDYEYADILHHAAKLTDPCEQLAYVAAYTISSYATTSVRTGKPFNPLLGETFECDRTSDLGWRSFSEQVSHHPPMLAQYCEGKGWTCFQEFTMTSKFRGKYLQVIPMGSAHLEFKNGNKYSWRKVTTTIHNIIVGKLWVDQHGDMEITGRNKAAGIKCHLKYIPYSYFTRDSQRRVKGYVMDQSGAVKYVLNGTWDDKVEIAPVISSTGSIENPVYQTGPSVVAWKRRMPPGDAAKYYNFTELAAQLNEPEEGVAPTDSRLRPDQRMMENGLWDQANQEKLRLEEKQRAVRKTRENDQEKAASEGKEYTPYQPLWFHQENDEELGQIVHKYNGDYWECKEKQDWSKCPDIF